MGIEIGVNADVAAKRKVVAIGKFLQFVEYAIEITPVERLRGRRVGKGLFERFRFLRFVDMSPRAHSRKNEFFSPRTVFGMLKGGIIVRGFDESRKDRGIREVEFFGLLAEVEIRRRAQSEATVTEIDGVEIFFEYLVLGISLFQRSGEFKFFQLAFDGLFLRKMGVFDELLGNGGGALLKRARLGVFQGGFRHALEVEAAVAVKALVLGVHEGVFRFRSQGIEPKSFARRKRRGVFYRLALRVEKLYFIVG